VLLRYILLSLLLLVVVRVVSRFLGGVLQGIAGPAGQGRARTGRSNAPAVKMARDPVCGTYVVPGKALQTTRGSETLFFCSAACRKQYLERRE
jgi:YHS domain-containing protein